MELAVEAVPESFGTPGRAAPPVPEQQQQQRSPSPSPSTQRPATGVSRYRSLRGKSISSPRRSRVFDVFRDGDTTTAADDAQPSSTPTRRSRSQSVTTALRSRSRSRSRSNAAKASAGDRHDDAAAAAAATRPPPLPTLKFPLGLRSVNTSSPVARRTDDSSQLQQQNGRKPAVAAAAVSPSKSSPQLLRPHHKDPQRQPPTTPRHDDQENRDPAAAAAASSPSSRWQDEVARLEAETDRILEEQKKRDLARLQAQLAATPSPRPRPKPKPTRLILDKLAFLGRGASRSNAAAYYYPPTPKSAPAKTFAFPPWSPAPSSADGTPSPETMSFIDRHSQVDAPTSAVNGGERRVTVRCLSSTINLPVTPGTSPVDIAFSTAGAVTHKIDPATSIVFECYEVLGLERRMRRFERVRDAMNSWDRDQQNSLLVVSYQTPQDDADLDLASVPRTENPPTGFTFQLYHSCRPGKWNKRWITLMDSGQVYSSKRPDAAPADKDSTTLCHMSDFDIYIPREDQARRHLKPPKAFCYAVKSQQRTALFPDGDNFVHFFSTDEEGLAHRFHELIHGWRSWYLANRVLGAQAGDSPSSLQRSATRKSTVSRRSTHRGRPSTDKRGLPGAEEYKPLVDMRQFDSMSRKSLDVSSRGDPTTPNRLPSTPSLPKTPQEEGEFLAGGLLGDAYDKRKQADASPVADSKSPEGPFVNGPSLLNNLPSPAPRTTAETKPAAGSWFPSAVEHSARTRSQSRPAQPRRPTTADTATTRRERPPAAAAGQFLEPPRPRMPGQRHGASPAGGRGVRPATSGPLIDYATGGITTSHLPVPTRSNTSATSAAATGRPRSRSTATARSAGQRVPPRDLPPMPPLPFRVPPGRVRDERETPTRGRQPRPQEPLIARVK